MIRRFQQTVGPWVTAATLALSFLLLALAGIYTVDQQRAVDKKICAQTVANRDAVRSTWLAAQDLILRASTDVEADVRTREFFQAVLMTIPPIECVDRKPVEVK